MTRTSLRNIIISATLSLLPLIPVQGKSNCQLAHEIDSIVRNRLPAGTDISISVWDLNGDSAIYSYRENVLCRPASTMKLFTSYTALRTLGEDYCFETSLKTDGSIDCDSILNGNLYLVGGLDPQLMESDLLTLARTLREKGIRRIRGKVIADTSIMDSIYWGSGWSWDDTPNSFQPYISPLMVHGGFIGISVRPDRRGNPPIVTTYPQSDWIKIRNEAITGDDRLGPVSIGRDWLHNDNTIVISGNVTRATSRDLNIFDCDKFTFALFREYLQQENICFEGYGWGRCPDSGNMIASATHSLKSVLKEALKESVNLNAEAMLLQAAHTHSHRTVSFNDAAKFMSEYLKKTLKPGSQPFFIVDGSGLSVYDYVPASLFIRLLRDIYSRPEVFEVFYDSMPVSGYDGTLKSRLATGQAAGKVHAKTGTLTGSCTLAGYVRASDGRDIAFCIMNEGAIKMASSRNVQDAICKIICQ